jgi:hypothetical protein
MDRDQMLEKYRRTYVRTADQAERFGWTIEHKLTESENFVRLDLKAIRGGESIAIWWEEGRLLEAPVYTFGGVETRLRNHSAMIQQMEKTPNVNRSARRAKARAGTTVQSLEVVKALPWDPDEMDDRELLRACYGKTLIWMNSFTGLPEQDQVWYGYWDYNKKMFVEDPQRGPNWNKINYHIKTSSTGRRAILFVGRQSYRAAGVDALLQVL